MEVGAITGHIDVAEVLVWVFFIFFAGLIIYLQRESQREGFPLENDAGTRTEHRDGSWAAAPKTFKLPHGPTEYFTREQPDKRTLALKKAFIWEGSPFVPTGDPMKDQVGPASYGERMDVPDWNTEGKPKIVPMRTLKEHWIPEKDSDPRGMTVFGCDGKPAGEVSDLWVDTAESLIRYLEVTLPAPASGASQGEEGASKPAAQQVLLPMNLAVVRGSNTILGRLTGIPRAKTGVFVHSITADQFKGVPKTARKTQVTLLEEDKIMGYYGGGKLYATPDRQEPYL